MAAQLEAEPVLALARAWAAVATGNQQVGASETLQFTAVWIAFNALYNLFSSGGKDYERVRRFALRMDVGARHLHLLETNESYASSVAVLTAQPVFNFELDEVVSVSDQRKVTQVMDVCYSVRGNLVHGRKDPEVERDRLLVRAAYEVILPLVTYFADPVHFLSRSETWQPAPRR